MNGGMIVKIIKVMARKKITYKEFKERFLIENYTNSKGEPVHTRLYKKYFYDS